MNHHNIDNATPPAPMRERFLPNFRVSIPPLSPDFALPLRNPACGLPTLVRMVRPSGVEPPLLSEHGPEPCASANSATGGRRFGEGGGKTSPAPRPTRGGG